MTRRRKGERRGEESSDGVFPKGCLYICQENCKLCSPVMAEGQDWGRAGYFNSEEVCLSGSKCV